MTTPNPPESATEAQGRALSDGIHSCSYFCSRPECIRAQRDELRDKLFPTPTDAARAPATQDAQALRAWIEGAWCAGYYDAGYTHDSAYAHKRAEEFADAALTQSAPQASPLPMPGSPEASAMMDSMLSEYGYPANMKNAARAGFEAARRLLVAPAAPLQAEPEAQREQALDLTFLVPPSAMGSLLVSSRPSESVVYLQPMFSLPLGSHFSVQRRGDGALYVNPLEGVTIRWNGLDPQFLPKGHRAVRLVCQGGGEWSAQAEPEASGNAPDSRYCPHTEEALPIEQCPHCMASRRATTATPTEASGNAESAVKCSACGNRLRDSEISCGRCNRCVAFGWTARATTATPAAREAESALQQELTYKAEILEMADMRGPEWRAMQLPMAKLLRLAVVALRRAK